MIKSDKSLYMQKVIKVYIYSELINLNVKIFAFESWFLIFHLELSLDISFQEIII